ncbi:MAG: biotin--[acetyl-CoA-carboxylase] ligase [Anaerolineae bacterium]|nr:biotin--[acetyl-CoA-carboxylase] ligase [Anaerolineae bacterium]
MAKDALSAEGILAGLKTRLVAQNLIYLPVVDSTMDEARRLAEQGAPDGTLVLTDYQTAGRGRLDRRWQAPPTSSLLLSFIFRPAIAPHQVQQLTMLCGLAVAESVEAQTSLPVGLKWPNDLETGGAKVGGILTEIELSGVRVSYAIVGIGLNVNLDPQQLNEPVLARATSLSTELGRPVARLPLLWAVLRAVEARYLVLGAGAPRLHAEWAKRLVTLGRMVTVSTGDATWEGVAEGVDADGALLVRRIDGSLERIIAGDVTVR